MTNNDVLIRLRYALNITDLKVAELFALVGCEIDRTELESIFKKEDEAGYAECSDELLEKFLEALVRSRRGPREGALPSGPPGARARLSNNDILKKLRVALELKDDDIIGILALSGVEVSKAEVSALFRRPGHPNYRPCGDQFLRNFLAGLTARYRV
ncbi:MAG TPA: DUF1456 family protein [Rectinemataceae bacterium]|nr:DUF1456 family protein [Rectinemataceae bacterium]